MAISDQLRQAIGDADETYYAIAKGADVNWSAIQRFANNERPNIRIDTVDRLCDYLGLELRPKKQPARKGKRAGK